MKSQVAACFFAVVFVLTPSENPPSAGIGLPTGPEGSSPYPRHSGVTLEVAGSVIVALNALHSVIIATFPAANAFTTSE